MFLGNPKDSGWEDWGTLGKIRGIITPGPLRIQLLTDASTKKHTGQVGNADLMEDQGHMSNPTNLYSRSHVWLGVEH